MFIRTSAICFLPVAIFCRPVRQSDKLWHCTLLSEAGSFVLCDCIICANFCHTCILLCSVMICCIAAKVWKSKCVRSIIDSSSLLFYLFPLFSLFHFFFFPPSFLPFSPISKSLGNAVIKLSKQGLGQSLSCQGIFVHFKFWSCD